MMEPLGLEYLLQTAGVTSVITTDGTYIDLTPNTATTGAVTVTADLSATDGNNTGTSQRFLTKNNTWAVPAYTTDRQHNLHCRRAYSYN